MKRCFLVVGVCVLGAVSTGAKASAATLTRAQKTMVDESIIPAYANGDSSVLIDEITRLTARLKPADQAAIDEHLATKQLPGMGDMLLAARTTQMQRGGDFLAPQPRPNEVPMLLAAFRRQAAKATDDVRALPAFAEANSTPGKLGGYEALFWSLDQARQRVANLRNVAVQIERVLRLDLRIDRAKLAPEQLEGLDADYAALARDFEQLANDLEQRSFELSLKRLEQSTATLRDAQDLKDRLLASHYLEHDGQVMTDFARRPSAERGRFTSSALSDPQLEAHVEQLVRDGRREAGDLLPKSNLLFSGLHWWARGRYGRGSEFHGLLKSPQAMHSDAVRMWAYMPNELPTNDQGSGYDYPDRRHFYTWIWEERTVQIRASSGGTRPLREPNAAVQVTLSRNTPTQLAVNAGFRGVSGRCVGPTGASPPGFGGMNYCRGDVWGPIDRPYSWTTADAYRALGLGDQYEIWQDRIARVNASAAKPEPQFESTTYIESYIPPPDPNQVYRLAGFVEYVRALECFDALSRVCNRDEMSAIDKLVEKRDELVVETNLSRHLNSPPSQLDEQPVRPGDDYRRRGFGWLSGLARCEAGAMMVGFADQTNALATLAMPYDSAEYKELVQDAARCHYWALQADRTMKPTLERDDNANRTLAYLRRVEVAKAFVDAAILLSQNDYSPAQQAELALWRRNIVQLEALLVKRLASFHQSTTVVEQR